LPLCSGPRSRHTGNVCRRDQVEKTGLSAPQEIFFQSSSVPYERFALLIIAAAENKQINENQR
jgi:hypothetical protein